MFSVNGVSLATATQAPYEARWSIDGLPSGPYVLSAEAFDDAGNSTSSEISVRLQHRCDVEPCLPIEIEWLEPRDGESVCRIVGFEVEVRSPNEVEQVQFCVDGDVIGFDTDAPWRVDWDTMSVPDGDVTVVAESFEREGNAAFEPVSVTVDNGGADCDLAPSVGFESPAEAAALRGLVQVVGVVDGEVESVTLFVAGTRHSSVEEPPFAFLWNSDTSEEGPASLRLLAAGLRGRSSEASVAVIVDRSPPTIAITSPFGGTYVEDVPLAADAVDAVGVAQVAWYRSDLSTREERDGAVLVSGAGPVALAGSDGAAIFDAAELGAGDYELFAVATDFAGLGASATALFSIDRPPTIEILSPEPASIVTGPTLVRVRVADDNGPVRLSLWQDGLELAEREAGIAGAFIDEYELEWAPRFVAGPQTFEVTVRDDAGRVDSDSLEVVVDHPPVLQVEVCRPVCERLESGLVFAGAVELNPTLLDDGDEELARAELVVDGLAVESSLGAPFSFEWDSLSVANGLHTLGVRAETRTEAVLELSADLVVAN